MTVPYSISAAHLLVEPGDVTLIDSLLTQAQLSLKPQIPTTICLMTMRSRPLSRLAARFFEIVRKQQL